MVTVTAAKMQKARIARILEEDPIKKAAQSVIEVIVMEGPACYMPRLILS